MIQEIYPHIFRNDYKNEKPNEDSYVLYFEDRSVLVKQEGTDYRFPLFKELEGIQDDTAVYLFSIDNKAYFLINDLSVKPLDFQLLTISAFRTLSPQYTAFAGVTAFSLHNWYTTHLFCGRCSHKMEHSNKERMLHCPQCGTMEYPKISPAIIVAVTNGDKILLSKYANREYTRYALLAGFAEIGESIEDTIKREVMEEVGLKVKNPVYYKSQPWGLSDTLLLGFFVELDGDDTITLDKEELAEAAWFYRHEIPPTESVISLTNEMIEYFRHAMAD